MTTDILYHWISDFNIVNMKSPVLWDVSVLSLVEIHRRFGGTYLLLLQDISLPLASCLVYSSTLKMEAVYYFEAPVNVYLTTRRHIPEDSTVQILHYSHIFN
jgi:hypothetical protein